jgi:hypothetical protein
LWFLGCFYFCSTYTCKNNNTLLFTSAWPLKKTLDTKTWEFILNYFLTPYSILYLYKYLTHPCIKYCCHLKAGTSNDALLFFNKVQKCIVNLNTLRAFKLEPQFHHHKVVHPSLFLKLHHGRCSKKSPICSINKTQSQKTCKQNHAINF